MSEDCIFCKIVNKEIPCELLLETESCIAFKDINPVAPHHYLVIPKAHIESLTALDADTSAAMIAALQKLAEKLGIKDFRTVFNTGAKAGQTVFHVHAHLIAGRDLEWPPG